MNAAATCLTTRFGTVEFTDADIVTFAEGLIGLPECCQFVLLQHREGSDYRWLQSLDRADLAFLVIDPAFLVRGYAPTMPDTTAHSLALDEDTPRLVYTIANIPPGRPREMTLNLAGPIVINAETRQAAQLVLENDKFDVRFRVFTDEAAA